MNDCLFCKIVAGEIPCKKIAETNDFLAFLDISPINEGHTLIVPKEHVKDFHEFPESLAESWVVFVKEVMAQVKAGVKADAMNLGMNNGAASGQLVFHQHTHLIPRFEGDSLKNWGGKNVTPEELEATAKKILG